MKEKLFVLMGPTAVGKTGLSIELAKSLNGEIISADSMQIYKYMDIGTAKVTTDEMESIPHHLISIVHPDESFTVSDYKEMASTLITDINLKGKLPIIVGGTGLYINSLVYKLNFASVAPDDSIRERLTNLYNKYGPEYLHDKLLRIDPESGARISINDTKRIIRALEIFEITGKTMSEYNKNFRTFNEDYDLAMICLNMDRSKLYERINHRVDIMIEQGLVEEVESILKIGYSKDLIALQGIGYKEIIMYFENKYSLTEAIDKIKQASRNYAKRQLTWFKRDNRIKWIDIDNYQNLYNLREEVESYVVETLYK